MPDKKPEPVYEYLPPDKKSEPVYEYLPPPREIKQIVKPLLDHVGDNEETPGEKLIRKCKEEPLVPLGCGLTAAALSYGIYTLRTGDRWMAQRMMRLRVTAQGFTILAVTFSLFNMNGMIEQLTKKKDSPP